MADYMPIRKYFLCWGSGHKDKSFIYSTRSSLPRINKGCKITFKTKDNPTNFQFAGREAIHSLIVRYKVYPHKQIH